MMGWRAWLLLLHPPRHTPLSVGPTLLACLFTSCRDTAALESFKAFFNVPNVEEGSNVVMLWRQPDTVDLLLCPPGIAIADMSQVL